MYRFESKYGANVDGYSPIYSPKTYATTGDTYKGGATGLAIWCARLCARARGPSSGGVCLLVPSIDDPARS